MGFRDLVSGGGKEKKKRYRASRFDVQPPTQDVHETPALQASPYVALDDMTNNTSADGSASSNGRLSSVSCDSDSTSGQGAGFRWLSNDEHEAVLRDMEKKRGRCGRTTPLPRRVWYAVAAVIAVALIVVFVVLFALKQDQTDDDAAARADRKNQVAALADIHAQVYDENARTLTLSSAVSGMNPEIVELVEQATQSDAGLVMYDVHVVDVADVAATMATIDADIVVGANDSDGDAAAASAESDAATRKAWGVAMDERVVAAAVESAWEREAATDVVGGGDDDEERLVAVASKLSTPTTPSAAKATLTRAATTVRRLYNSAHATLAERNAAGMAMRVYEGTTYLYQSPVACRVFLLFHAPSVRARAEADAALAADASLGDDNNDGDDGGSDDDGAKTKLARKLKSTGADLKRLTLDQLQYSVGNVDVMVDCQMPRGWTPQRSVPALAPYRRLSATEMAAQAAAASAAGGDVDATTPTPTDASQALWLDELRFHDDGDDVDGGQDDGDDGDDDDDDSSNKTTTTQPMLARARVLLSSMSSTTVASDYPASLTQLTTWQRQRRRQRRQAESSSSSSSRTGEEGESGGVARNPSGREMSYEEHRRARQQRDAAMAAADADDDDDDEVDGVGDDDDDNDDNEVTNRIPSYFVAGLNIYAEVVVGGDSGSDSDSDSKASTSIFARVVSALRNDDDATSDTTTKTASSTPPPRMTATLQLSLPFDLTRFGAAGRQGGAGGDGAATGDSNSKLSKQIPLQLSTTTPVRATLRFGDHVSLALPPTAAASSSSSLSPTSSSVSSAGVMVYLEGMFATGVTKVLVSTAVTLTFNGGRGSDDKSADESTPLLVDADTKATPSTDDTTAEPAAASQPTPTPTPPPPPVTGAITAVAEGRWDVAAGVLTLIGHINAHVGNDAGGDGRGSAVAVNGLMTSAGGSVTVVFDTAAADDDDNDAKKKTLTTMPRLVRGQFYTYARLLLNKDGSRASGGDNDSGGGGGRRMWKELRLKAAGTFTADAVLVSVTGVAVTDTTLPTMLTSLAASKSNSQDDASVQASVADTLAYLSDNVAVGGSGDDDDKAKKSTTATTTATVVVSTYQSDTTFDNVRYRTGVTLTLDHVRVVGDSPLSTSTMLATDLSASSAASLTATTSAADAARYGLSVYLPLSMFRRRASSSSTDTTAAAATASPRASVTLTCHDIPLPLYRTRIKHLNFHLTLPTPTPTPTPAPADATDAGTGKPATTAAAAAAGVKVTIDAAVSVQPFATQPATNMLVDINYDGEARVFSFSGTLTTMPPLFGVKFVTCKHLTLDVRVTLPSSSSSSPADKLMPQVSAGDVVAEVSSLATTDEDEKTATRGATPAADDDKKAMTTAGGLVVNQFALSVEVAFNFGSGGGGDDGGSGSTSDDGPTLKLTTIRDGSNLVLAAAGVSVDKVHPALGRSLSGKLLLFFANAGTTVTFAGGEHTLQPGVTLKTGAEGVTVAPGGLGGSLDAIASSSSSSSSSSSTSDKSTAPRVYALAGYMSTRGTRRLDLTLTASSLPFSGRAMTVNDVRFFVSVTLPSSQTPTLTSARGTLSGVMRITLPRNPPLTLAVSMDFDVAKRAFVCDGVLSAWPKPFGVDWLTIGDAKLDAAAGEESTTAKSAIAAAGGKGTHVRLIIDRGLPPPEEDEEDDADVDTDDAAAGENTADDTKMLIVHSSVQFRGSRMKVCGAVSGRNAALVVTGIKLKGIKTLVCEILKLCKDSELLDESAPAPAVDVNVAVALSTRVFTRATWAHTSMCHTTMPDDERAFLQHAPAAGVTIRLQFNVKGKLLKILQKVLPSLTSTTTGGDDGDGQSTTKQRKSGMTAQGWEMNVNIPFGKMAAVTQSLLLDPLVNDDDDVVADDIGVDGVAAARQQHAAVRRLVRALRLHTAHSMSHDDDGDDNHVNNNVGSSSHAVVVRDDVARRHARTQSVVSKLSKFNVNFEQRALNLQFPDGWGPQWITVTGVAVKGRPFHRPAPDFSARLYATIRVHDETRNATQNLYFDVSGTVKPTGAFILSGRMLTDGRQHPWRNALGLRGFNVYSASVALGIGTTGVDTVALSFDVEFGRIALTFAGGISVSDASAYALGKVAPVSRGATKPPPLCFADLADALRVMSNNRLNVPSWLLPPPSFLSFSHVHFSIATRAGTTPDGEEYDAGLRFDVQGTLFAVDIAVSGGTVPRQLAPPPTPPVVDFLLNLEANFAGFNKKMMEWITSLSPFDFLDDFLSKTIGSSLCDLACIHRFSVKDFSVLDMVTGKRFPTIYLAIKFVGRTFKIGPWALDFKLFSLSAVDLFKKIKTSLADKFPKFCVINRHCKNGQKCNHRGFTCVDECPDNTRSIRFAGCFPRRQPKVSDIDWLTTLKTARKIGHPDAVRAFSSQTRVQPTFNVSDDVHWFERVQGADPYKPLEFARFELDRQLYKHSPGYQIDDDGKRDMVEAVSALLDLQAEYDEDEWDDVAAPHPRMETLFVS